MPLELLLFSKKNLISFKLKFKLKDVQVIEDMFTSFRAKDVPLFVDGQQFYEPLHYGKIMGYDKPYKPLQFEDENKTEKNAKNHED
jgi:hypothetical protein